MSPILEILSPIVETLSADVGILSSSILSCQMRDTVSTFWETPRGEFHLLPTVGIVLASKAESQDPILSDGSG